MLTIRRLQIRELAGVYDIDMTERGATVYKLVDGALEAVAQEWQRPPRTKAQWDSMIAGWETVLAGGGSAWGAFEDGRMVGIAVLRNRLQKEMAQLSALFVSRPYRRCGVARRLTNRIFRAARASGARQIYVSATPSASTIGFYRDRGFDLAETVSPDLYALEPDDIHMVRPL